MAKGFKARESKFKSFEGHKLRHELLVEHGVTPADLTRPDFWSHVCKKMKPRDIIEIDFEDNSYYVVARVMCSEPTSASVMLLETYALDTFKFQEGDEKKTLSLKPKSDDFQVEFDAKSKWRALRKSDRSIAVSGYETKEKCFLALTDYLSRLAA